MRTQGQKVKVKKGKIESHFVSAGGDLGFGEKTNFYQVNEQTEEEKIAMYMKLPKKELVQMLRTNQKMLDKFLVKGPTYVSMQPCTCRLGNKTTFPCPIHAYPITPSQVWIS